MHLHSLPISLRKAKTLWSFGLSACSRVFVPFNIVKLGQNCQFNTYNGMYSLRNLSYWQKMIINLNFYLVYKHYRPLSQIRLMQPNLALHCLLLYLNNTTYCVFYSWKKPQFNSSAIRIVLFTDSDIKGRNLIFDSKAVIHQEPKVCFNLLKVLVRV